MLQNELLGQKIQDYRICQGILDGASPRAGILRAHQQVVAWTKRNGLGEICIAEDDVQFSSPGAFEYFINQKPKEYDLYLGGIKCGEIQSDQS